MLLPYIEIDIGTSYNREWSKLNIHLDIGINISKIIDKMFKDHSHASLDQVIQELQTTEWMEIL